MARAVLIRGGWVYPGAERADVWIRDGRIEATGLFPQMPRQDVEELDATGCWVIPGLVEAHCHLDKTLWGGPWVADRGAATIADRVALSSRNRDYGLPSEEHAAALLRQMVSRGTTHVRTHTDVDPVAGLRGIEVIQRVAAGMQHAVSVEQVAFPQSGIARAPGTAALLRRAVRQPGVVAVGGIDPAGFDGDPRAQLQQVFEVAAEEDRGVDIHLHDGGDLGVWELDLIVEYTRVFALQGRVTVSHAYALGMVAPAVQRRLCEALAEHRVSLVTAIPFDRPLPPVSALLSAGVVLGLGSDNIQDLWSPFGNGDILERASLLAWRSEWRTDAELETALRLATFGGADVLHLERYGTAPGCAADLVVVPARTIGELVARHPQRRWTIKGGVVTHPAA